MSGNPYTPSESYTVRTIAGEEMEIVEKIDVDGVTVLVTAEDQRYVPSDQNNGLVQPFDPEKHVGGNPATGEAAAKWTPAADATEAAEARAAHEQPADATEAAEATAELEASLAQQPVAEEKPLPVPVPSNKPPTSTTPPPKK